MTVFNIFLYIITKMSTKKKNSTFEHFINCTGSSENWRR